MKLDTLLRLLDAGYSRDEIMALEEGSDQTGIITIDNDEAPEAAPDPEPAVSAGQAPEPAAVDKTAQLISQLTAQVSSLTQTIQRSNLLNAQQPPAPEADSAEKILASIITPKH